ncbi:hypothetical protein XAB3213_1250005 [Xanthomonas citri pv. bilvae]|nr:hypothetical protein XAB3213_1250005 [Xanthomonas citri pv. bilvae]
MLHGWMPRPRNAGLPEEGRRILADPTRAEYAGMHDADVEPFYTAWNCDCGVSSALAPRRDTKETGSVRCPFPPLSSYSRAASDR